MNENPTNENRMNGDRIIIVSDLFEEILRRIWLIIVLAIVFAVLFAGYKYMSDRSKAAAVTNAESYAEAESALSDEEMQEVNSILLLYDDVDSQEEYMQNSVLMNIDPYHEDRVTLQFLLQSNADMMPSILQALENYVAGGALVADLQEYYPEEEGVWLSELISCEQNDLSQVQSGETAGTENNEEETTVSTRTIFGVQVIHSDTDAAEQLADDVTQCLNAYADQLNSYLKTCEFSLIGQNATQIFDSELKNNQSNAVSNIISQQNKIVTQRESLSDEQVKVLEAALAEDAGSEDAVGAKSSSDTAAQTAKKVRISGRYVAIGVVVGIVVGIILIVLYYILRGTLNVAQEMPRVFDIPVFGQVHRKRQRNPLVRGWRRLLRKKKALPPETEQRIVLTNLMHFCKNHQVSRLLLAGSREDLSENAWLNEVREALQKEQIGAEIIGGLPDSPDALETLDQYECVALVETLHSSIYKDIVREVELCEEQQKQVAGAIILD